MKNSNILKISSIILIALGILMIVLGLAGEKVVLPPVVTGLGFFVIAGALFSFKNDG